MDVRITCLRVFAASACVTTALFWLFRQRSVKGLRKEYVSSVKVENVIFYPIKGCKGIQRYSIAISDNGLENDRIYAVLQSDSMSPVNWKALSQTKYPKLACVSPSDVTDSSLSIRAPGMAQLFHQAVFDGPKILIDLWGDTVEAIDQGDPASDWFSLYLGTPVRFVRIIPGKHRKDTTGISKPSSLFYRTPILLMAKESVEELSVRVQETLSYERFRPNIVLSGLRPFEEDSIARIRIGNVILDISELCERCSIPAVNPKTGELQTGLLAKMRNKRSVDTVKKSVAPKGVIRQGQYYLGVYYVPRIVGSLSRIFVGQEISIVYLCILHFFHLFHLDAYRLVVIGRQFDRSFY
jgi:uncharacterized protein YcbX